MNMDNERIVHDLAKIRNHGTGTIINYCYCINKYSGFFKKSMQELLDEADEAERNQIRWKSKNPTSYWSTLKQRLVDEGNQTVTNCDKLKMLAADGKMRLTDVLNTKEVLRLVQSIPSPKTEPFKIWLAEVGQERFNEIADPELAFERAIETYRAKGYSEAWITQN